MKESTDSAFKRFFRRIPLQSRSRAVVRALVEALDERLRQGEDPSTLPVDRLAKRAGVGVGSFYEYFAGKDALLGTLIGQITRENFAKLLHGVPQNGASLEAVVEKVADATTHTYLEHPARTRIVIAGIARLGLIEVITSERDRFSDELARAALPFRPRWPEEVLAARMRAVSDAAMGIITAELYRASPRSPERIVSLLVSTAVAMLPPEPPL